MADYYQILGVPQSASSDVIKSAFKKLALKYHPDRNPGDLVAEEKFKEINKAYQTLSNPYSKYQYDLKLNYSRHHSSGQFYQTNTSNTSNRKSQSYSPPFRDYSPPFTRPQTGKRHKQYEYGWQWIKAQLYAFGFVFLVALLVYGAKTWYTDYKISEAKRLAELREKALAEADSVYQLGQYRKALAMVLELQKKNPIESKIANYREKVVKEIREKAELQFNLFEYDSAINYFSIVKDYQRFHDLRVYEKLMECYLALEEYEQAANVIDYILEREPRNLIMYHQISSIYYNKLNNADAALEYLNRAKKIIKETLIATYGYAYEIVMLPENAPDIYFDIHLLRAQANMDIGDFRKAVSDLKWTIFLNENHLDSYKMRSEAYFRLNNKPRGCKDLQNATELGDSESANLFSQICVES